MGSERAGYQESISVAEGEGERSIPGQTVPPACTASQTTAAYAAARWDAAQMRFTNNPKANEYLKPTFRKGWSWT
jgi:hypothetical protein